VDVVLTAKIPDGTHIESHQPPEPSLIPTVVEVDGIDQATVEYPAPVRKDLGFASALELWVYEGAPRFIVRGEAPPEVGRVRGRLRYQPCVNGACLPPRTAVWEASLERPDQDSNLGPTP
jgi:cytochrome c biogenesis DsbD-like protein